MLAILTGCPAFAAADPAKVPPALVETCDRGAIFGDFTWAGWARPQEEISFLPPLKIDDYGEFLIYPDAGHSLYGRGHAGAGLAVGRNGVQILEHGENFFEPVLRWEGPVGGEASIAVVYRDGTPSLFVNGTLVATGSKSRWVVHPGSQAGGPKSERFSGQARGWKLYGRALEPDQVRRFSQSEPEADRLPFRDGEDFQPGWARQMMPRREADAPHGAAATRDALGEIFADPPASTAPWVYWYWISDRISKEGITRDLEEMKKVGIGAAAIGHIALPSVPAGDVKMLGPEWTECVRHAIREGARIGVDIGLFNCPGWSQAGGPWVPPEKSMRYLATTETVVSGPSEFRGHLAHPGLAGSPTWLYAYPLPGTVDETPIALTFTAEGMPDISRLDGADPANPQALEGASWIWKTVENVGSADPETVFFRRVFLLPSDRQLTAATLTITADDEFDCWVNGTAAAAGTSWTEVRSVDIASKLQPGTNVVAVSARNHGSGPNPAGLVAKLTMEFASGPPEEWGTDSQWKASSHDPGNWKTAGFDDAGWAPAMVAGPAGMGPWGPLRLPALSLHGEEDPVVLRMTSPGLVAVQTLRIFPGMGGLTGWAELRAKDSEGKFQTVARLQLDRPGNAMRVNEGFAVLGPLVAAFPVVEAREFELVLSHAHHGAQIEAIQLLSAPRLDRYVQKQLGKMHFNPLPTDAAYRWPRSPEPASRAGILAAGQMIDLSSNLSEDGNLVWNVPEGRWLLLRAGLAQVGSRNAPASREGEGWEIDKMSPEMVRWHFDQFVGELQRGLAAEEREALKYVISDSWEMGSQNWSDDSAARFRRQFGYDPEPWFPVLTGRLVESAEDSERFLWDLRRFVADEVATGFVGGLQAASEENGLELWLENYGHCGFPGEFLQYGGRADRIAGEFWTTGDLGPMEIRGASSASHIYGKPVVSAEAFTSASRLFGTTPALLKRRGDWALTEGINHYTLHVALHQPDDLRPGIQTWFGTEFNRHNTWFAQSRSWITYFRRAQALLQQGLHVADLALLVPEDAPRMDGTSRAVVPPGFDFDYVNAEVLLQSMQVRDGHWVLPDGKSYRLLHLPEGNSMRPELLRRIAELVQEGGTLVGTPPVRSPSLAGRGQADEEVRRLAGELWGETQERPASSRRQGKGRVFWGVPLHDVVQIIGLAPDVGGLDPEAVRWIHRRIGQEDLYFLSNQTDLGLALEPEFRIAGRAPELWYPATGRRVPTAAYQSLPHSTRVRVCLNPMESVFVVFRAAPAAAPSVVGLSRDGVQERPSGAPAGARFRGNGEYSDSAEFTMMGWVRPRMDTSLPPELRWEEVNEVTPIRPGHRVTEPPGTAFATLSAGRNGVVVLASGAAVLEPVLTHRHQIHDWMHVALTANDGRLTLFLDGHQVAEERTGRFSLRSIASVDGGQRSMAFRGEMTDVTSHDWALSAAEIAQEAARTDPRQSSFLPVSDLRWNADGGITAEVLASGDYQFKLSDGTAVPVQVKALPEPQTLSGPWTVKFPPEHVAAGDVVLEKLVSLTAHPDPQVRFFSGTAVYRTDFDLPAVPPRTRVYLDLGDACDGVVEADLNGTDLGGRWNPPYGWDVTAFLRAGANQLQIAVTGTWRNRLIGELRDPEAFADTSFRPYLASWGDARLHADEAMLPSGLLGPVRLIFSREVSLPTAASAGKQTTAVVP